METFSSRSLSVVRCGRIGFLWDAQLLPRTYHLLTAWIEGNNFSFCYAIHTGDRIEPLPFCYGVDKIAVASKCLTSYQKAECEGHYR